VTQTGPPAPPLCYTHPGRPAGAVCRRCGRPICPDCMREAPVGWQCAACVHEGHRQAPVVRWRPQGGAGRLGRTRVTPVVIALIAVNVVAFVFEERAHFDEYLVAHYFLVPDLVHQRPLMLITSAFLHVSVVHILLNMATLAIVGPAVEAEVGSPRFALLYLLAALGGSVGFYLLAPANEAGAGASGAIFGLMGAYFVLARMRGWETQTITVLLVVNIAFSFSGGIAWQAHLGGLVTGVLVTLGLVWHPAGLGRPTAVAQGVQAVAVAVAAVAVLAALLQVPRPA
jgi:membrane associated rhomboid family serine protease